MTPRRAVAASLPWQASANLAQALTLALALALALALTLTLTLAPANH